MTAGYFSVTCIARNLAPQNATVHIFIRFAIFTVYPLPHIGRTTTAGIMACR